MKQLSQNLRTGKLKLDDTAFPAVLPGQVQVQTAYSLISAGTERTKIETGRKTLLGKALARPDQVEQVLRSAQQLGLNATIQKVRTRLDSRSPLGYSAAGMVLAVGDGVVEFRPGDRVACGGASAAHAEVIAVPKSLVTLVPHNTPLNEAAFTTVGAVALQGIRQADLRVGEIAVVLGLGLVGQLTFQILRASGCSVVGYDIDPDRIRLAEELGIDKAACDENALRTALSAMTGSRGADAVIITAGTSSNRPVELAGELSRDKGRVVVVGAVGLGLPRSSYYDKELDFCLSRSYGPGRYDPNYEEKGVDYPYGFVRWTEQRNMAAFLKLVSEGKINVAKLITHQFSLEQAEVAYSLIRGATREKYLGVLFSYGGQEIMNEARTPTRPARSVDSQKLTVGVIGAGNFAQSMLLPHLKANSKVDLRGVTTLSSLESCDAVERFRFAYTAPNAAEIIKDDQISGVVIATRHDSHAALIIEAIKAGKAVHVEKPMAMSDAELDGIIQAYQEARDKPFVMVGFNRRFAPLVGEAQRFMEGVGEPRVIQIRVNAGYIPLNHWTQDLQQGGGRIVGEVCHFLDLAQFLACSKIKSVYAKALPNAGKYLNDNVAVTVEMENSAVANIVYAANGDRGLGKERIEIFGSGRVAIIDDYQYLEMISNGKRKISKHGVRDKGHQQEMRIWVRAVLGAENEPVPFLEAVVATRASLALLKSLQTGNPIRISP